jgi:hypothetical protein
MGNPFMIPIVLFVSVFSFLAVAFWSISRRRERESLYLNETLRKISELHGQQAMFEYLRENERIRTRRFLAALNVGGILTAALGVALTIFLFANHATHEEQTYFVGLIPLLAGLGLLAYSRGAAKG